MPYDYLVVFDKREIKIQVKLQRSVNKIPMTVKKKGTQHGWHYVETQKTRNGEVSIDNKIIKTRFYSINDFDILAVCMEPSTNDWNSFRYGIAKKLERSNKYGDNFLSTMQKISPNDTETWFSDLGDAIRSL